MANSPQNFVFNSDFPCDMITYVYSYDETTPASSEYSSYIKEIPHNLGYRPLLFGVWATDSDFTDTHTIGDSGFNDTAVETVRAYDDHIEVVGTFTTATHIYVRIYGFAPSTWTGYSPATNTSSNSRLLDSDKGYSKLLFEGAFKSKAISSASDITTLQYSTKNGYIFVNNAEANAVRVVHSLGFLPSVMLWADDGTKTYPAYGCTFDYYSGWYSDSYPSAEVTKTDVQIDTGTIYDESQAITTHIRIYADE